LLANAADQTRRYRQTDGFRQQAGSYGWAACSLLMSELPRSFGKQTVNTASTTATPAITPYTATNEPLRLASSPAQ
jgi:hypothetical protein